MIACQDASPAVCAVEPSAAEEIEPRIGQSPLEFACPRTVEILTILNDVFDSFCPHADGGMLTGAGTA